MFKDIHPSGSGGVKKSPPLSEKSPSEIDDSKFVKCYQCGMYNDGGKITIGDSEDVLGPLIKTVTMTIPGGTKDIKTVDETALSGCRFCGSLNSDLHSKKNLEPRKTPRGYRG